MNTQNIINLKVAGKTETTNNSIVATENQNLGLNQKKSFTAADMWNIQRQSRSMFTRRRCA